MAVASSRAELQTPTDLKANAVRDVPAALRALLADVFALYLKTKNFHWHMSGR
jgi:starvation-inducible DNA-binding protein